MDHVIRLVIMCGFLFALLSLSKTSMDTRINLYIK